MTLRKYVDRPPRHGRALFVQTLAGCRQEGLSEPRPPVPGAFVVRGKGLAFVVFGKAILRLIPQGGLQLIKRQVVDDVPEYRLN